MRDAAPSIALTDHVDLAPLDTAGYIAAVVLWLAGVAFIVVHKLRAAR
jgi:hypothetical protein